MTQIQSGAVIYAKDFLRVANFYNNTTSLAIRTKDKSFVTLESESFQLVVIQAPSRIAGTIDIADPPKRREETPIKLVFFVGSISQHREIVKKFGGELYGKEKEWEFDEQVVCDGIDPEGNIFQLRAPS